MSTRTAQPRLTFRISEVAEQLGVDPSTVARWAADGRLASVRINGVVLIKPEHLDAFLNAHTEGDELVPRRHRSTRKPRSA